MPVTPEDRFVEGIVENEGFVVLIHEDGITISLKLGALKALNMELPVTVFIDAASKLLEINWLFIL